jgi:HAD superfamily phosphoserine phosphatase-like hydrolase
MAKFCLGFDVDGTLLRWNSLHLLLVACVENGCVSADVLTEANQRLAEYKERKGTFQAFIDALLKAEKCLNGVAVIDVADAARRVVESGIWASVFCAETLQIAREWTQCVPVIFTGTPQVMAQAIAAHYNIRHVFGTQLLTDHSGNLYTGESDDSVLQNKGSAIRRFAEEHEIDLTQSIAVGDSEGDITMLQAVGHPIALNPNAGLMRACTRYRYPYVLEKKIVHPFAWKAENPSNVATPATMADLLPAPLAAELTARLRELDMLV